MDKDLAWTIVTMSLIASGGVWLYYSDLYYKPLWVTLIGGYAMSVIVALVGWALTTVFLG